MGTMRGAALMEFPGIGLSDDGIAMSGHTSKSEDRVLKWCSAFLAAIAASTTPHEPHVLEWCPAHRAACSSILCHEVHKKRYDAWWHHHAEVGMPRKARIGDRLTH